MSNAGINLVVGNNYALAENTSRAILLYIYPAVKAVIIATKEEAINNHHFLDLGRHAERSRGNSCGNLT
jgi:hypothetical protein